MAPRVSDRLAKLEERLGRRDVFRVICVDEQQDRDEALKRYRQETGYHGVLVAMNEVDRAL